MVAFVKIIFLLLRNQLFLKPVAWPAARYVRQHIRDLGFKPKSVRLWLGLAGPDHLTLVVIFGTDEELLRFQEKQQLDIILKQFQDRLSRSYYPEQAAREAQVKFYSHEEILRTGGYYRYFK